MLRGLLSKKFRYACYIWGGYNLNDELEARNIPITKQTSKAAQLANERNSFVTRTVLGFSYNIGKVQLALAEEYCNVLRKLDQDPKGRINEICAILLISNDLTSYRKQIEHSVDINRIAKQINDFIIGNAYEFESVLCDRNEPEILNIAQAEIIRVSKAHKFSMLDLLSQSTTGPERVAAKNAEKLLECRNVQLVDGILGHIDKLRQIVNKPSAGHHKRQHP